MTGWPRPNYPGDFIAAKFYDLPPEDSVIVVTDTPKLIARLVVPENSLVPGDLYQIWFGPFAYRATNPDVPEDQVSVIDLAVFHRLSPDDPRVPVGKRVRFNAPVNSGFQTIPMYHSFFEPKDQAAHIFEVLSVVQTGLGNVNRISLDLTLFGVSAVAEQGSFRTVKALP